MDLKRQLALRITAFALLIWACASVAVLQQALRRIEAHVERSGATIERLIGTELDQRREFVARRVEGLQLALLEQMGASLRLCVRIQDLTGSELMRRCFAADAEPHPLTEALLARLVGARVEHRGSIGQYPGIKVGEFTVTPDLRAEAEALAGELRLVLLITVGVLLLNLLVYLPVRRALRPTEQVLATIDRLRAGDLTARMPRPPLAELRRIAEGFDELAARLQATDGRQKRLARRLLDVREEERRRLARELHDEFGQCLASIRAEAAFGAGAAAGTPALLPPFDAIRRVAGSMMENLQRILQQLRPVGLEAFGLRAGLAQLVVDAQRQRPACRIDLQVAGPVDALDDPLTVAIYRIVQESLTNALRHGAPESVVVGLVCEASQLRLDVEDDGSGDGNGQAGSGMGVLGMRERVLALGGRFRLTARSPRGTRVSVVLPLAAPAADNEGEDDGADTPDAGR